MIRKVSKSRSRQNPQYQKVKKEWKKDLEKSGQWKCRKCGAIPEDQPHHKFGRIGRLLCMSELFVPVCWPCHQWIGSNPTWARELGLLCEKGQWNTVPR